MRRQGERFLTPKEWREMRRRMNLWRKIENASYQLALRRIKQSSPLMSGPDFFEVLISELSCHSAARRAIEKSDLD